MCSWKGYKATVLHQQQKIASSFQKNEVIINWVNSQKLAPVVTCLGDGHDGVWNIIIDRRTKISGAQWKAENVPQVLAHRCAYLNGLMREGIFQSTNSFKESCGEL